MITEDPNNTDKPLENGVRYGWTTVPVLPNLIGCPWDEVSRSLVRGLNPTAIRVLDHDSLLTLDVHTGRITVTLIDGMVFEVEQEVQVPLPEGISCGQSLELALRYGKDSEEVRAFESHLGDGIVFTPANVEGVAKVTVDLEQEEQDDN